MERRDYSTRGVVGSERINPSFDGVAANPIERPELFHYTDGPGLNAILTRQTLRATHIRYMNDAAEYLGYFRNRLPHLIAESVATRCYGPMDQRLQSLINTAGGVEPLANKIGEIKALEMERACEMHIPFVTCFCTTVDPYVSRHGLLSQWRAYGSDGGYAIVFDLKDLHSAVGVEVKRYVTNSAFFQDVDYHAMGAGPTVRNSAFTRQWEGRISEYVISYLESDSTGNPADTYEAIIRLAATTKHRGFEEEREVRMVICLPSFEQRRTQGLVDEMMPVEFRSKGGTQVPFITLFGKGSKLPIRRIIVGPHPDRETRCDSLKLLVAQHDLGIEVVYSDTPYRGT